MAKPVGGSFQGFGIASTKGHGRAEPDQFRSNGFADAAATPCDQGDVAGERIFRDCRGICKAYVGHLISSSQ
jgi:hypothetical protein